MAGEDTLAMIKLALWTMHEAGYITIAGAIFFKSSRKGFAVLAISCKSIEDSNFILRRNFFNASFFCF